MSREESRISTETRHRAASLALIVTAVLTAMKFVVAFISGSVGVLSEAVHSLLDLLSAGLSYFTVQHAIKPADESHAFGHGKIETLSSLFEAVLLVVAAGLIVNEGIAQLNDPRPLQYQNAAILVILFSLIASWFAYSHNLRAAKETDSSALHVNALHFLSDVVASVGVLVGLILIKVTGWMIVDPIMAFLVAAYILGISLKQIAHTLRELSDGRLPETEIQVICGILNEFKGHMIEAHDLRTRKSGSMRHVDFHLVVCGQLTVDASHEVCDQMEKKIIHVFPRTSVNIHVEPCEADRSTCHTKKDCQVFWRAKGGRTP
ncbi:MAG TPA: cation diffusion facilitator family transporter [Bdellovibrionota bacterium]|nr:cation diffusion facilitator family transporter [Bdellovibrionota bacterium]